MKTAAKKKAKLGHLKLEYDKVKEVIIGVLKVMKNKRSWVAAKRKNKRQRRLELPCYCNPF